MGNDSQVKSSQVKSQVPVIFTDKAAQRVLLLIKEAENPNLKFRAYITGGGCSGFQYGFTFDEVQNDDDIVKECVVRSKSCSQKGMVASKGSGKQDIIITLNCKDHPTNLNFSIRTNKSGINHKLGQFINLAFKFNGVSK